MKCNLDNLKEALAGMAKDGKVDGIPLEVAMMRLSSRYTAMRIEAIAGSSKFKDNMKIIGAVGTKVAENAQIGAMGDNSKNIVQNLETAYRKDRKTALQHLPKELAKASVATKMIGQGSAKSSAETIRQVYNSAGLANNEEYTSNDVVYLSANGNRAGRVVPVSNGELQGVYKLVDKAITAGASFVADSSTHLSKTGTYNLGEVALAEYLAAHGYIRSDIKVGKETIGKWTKGAVPSKTVETVEQVVGVLKTDGTHVTFADGKSSKKVDSLHELTKIAGAYERIMRAQGKATAGDMAHVKQMFDLLEKNGVEFKSIRVTLAENTSKGSKELGRYDETVKGDKYITLHYDRKHNSANPSQIVLHEYIHAVTLTAIKKDMDLSDRIVSLMEHALKADPSLGEEYGLMPDKTGKLLPTEFVAEVLSNPRLQAKLDKIELPNEMQSVADAVLQWFKDILEALRGKDISQVTALTKALELTMEALQEEKDVAPMNASASYAGQLDVMPKGTKQYHVSDASFDKFAVAGDEIPGYGKLKTVGSHIGEVESAKEYEKQQTWSKGKVKYEITANADVSTLEMIDPGDSNWTADTMYDELVEKYGEVPFTKESDAKEVLEFLRGKGIDAIKYKNTAEAGVSYMVVNPEKFDLKKIEEWPGEQMQEVSKAEAKPEIGKMSLAELLKEAAECKE